jgi:hypothetical protein
MPKRKKEEHEPQPQPQRSVPVPVHEPKRTIERPSEDEEPIPSEN